MEPAGVIWACLGIRRSADGRIDGDGQWFPLFGHGPAVLNTIRRPLVRDPLVPPSRLPSPLLLSHPAFCERSGRAAAAAVAPYLQRAPGRRAKRRRRRWRSELDDGPATTRHLDRFGTYAVLELPFLFCTPYIPTHEPWIPYTHTLGKQTLAGSVPAAIPFIPRRDAKE